MSTDLLSHAVDLAMHLVGPITDVVGTGETFIRERPLAGIKPPKPKGIYKGRKPTAREGRRDQAACV